MDTDETFLRTMLFDFYGELLTEKQRECYDLHYNQDLSLQEIADATGTSRQAVWDLIRRADRTLREFEEKTGLLAKSLERREQLRTIGRLVRRLPECPEKRGIQKILLEFED